MKADNSVVVDLNKVQYAYFYYINQHGNVRRHKLRQPTVYNSVIVPTDFCVGSTFRPPETMIERAKRTGILDIWNPVLRLQLTANHSLKYTGDKAKSIWKEWQKKIFK